MIVLNNKQKALNDKPQSLMYQAPSTPNRSFFFFFQTSRKKINMHSLNFIVFPSKCAPTDFYNSGTGRVSRRLAKGQNGFYLSFILSGGRKKSYLFPYLEENESAGVK